MNTQQLTLTLANDIEMKWAQQQVTDHHYLHHPVDVRCRPLAYLVRYFNKPMGCLIFGRPESTRCNGWYGSVEDVQAGRCPLTRWQVLNLARVWLDPRLQFGGKYHVPNAASQVISMALRSVGYDFLIHRPPVWMEEPYEIREVLSYNDNNSHRGTLYQACSFQLRRTNDRGIETYVRQLRRLTHSEHAEIARRSQEDQRARRMRAARTIQQLTLFEEVTI